VAANGFALDDPVMVVDAHSRRVTGVTLAPAVHRVSGNVLVASIMTGPNADAADLRGLVASIRPSD